MTRQKRRVSSRRKRRRHIGAALLLVLVSLAVFFPLSRYLIRQVTRLARHGVYVIAVDAGHGGDDTGACGVREERDMTAQTAQLLTNLLEADPHFCPVPTRSSYDTTALPSERVAEANRQDADLLLSIHGNSNSASSATTGFECFPVTPGRTEHDESMRFAGLLAGEMQQAGASLRGGNGIRYAYYDSQDQKHIVDSSDSSIHIDNTFTILERSHCPAVLAEQCFVTSPEDIDRFGDEDGCALAADCYYRAICAYFGYEPVGSTAA